MPNNDSLPERDATDAAKDAPRIVQVQQADGTIVAGQLPPMSDIYKPPTLTKSALIRWLNKLGYTVGEIHKGLGIKYQMVRNITTTIPKRAAREDLPPLVITYLPEKDFLEAALDGALEASLLTERKERLKAQKQLLRQDYEQEMEDDEGGLNDAVD